MGGVRKMLAFIHLSDIHFNKSSGGRYDLDEDLRNELLRDVTLNYTKHIPKTDGILICGDVAFSGKQEQYDVAVSFLKHLCAQAHLDETEVFCVPGNHDVDQSVAAEEMGLKELQNALEAENCQGALDERVSRIMMGTKTHELLAKPLENYTEHFASQYSCNMRDLLTWTHDFELDGRYSLRLFGINSTLISNADDHAAKWGTAQRPMRLSILQVPMNKDGVVYLTLCHHPPEHWNDPDGALARLMDDRVAVQLYGHKHLQKIIHRGKTLIVGSGATHPSRLEPDWQPRYNWLTLDVVPEKDELKVAVYQRVYHNGRFVADCEANGGMDCMTYYLQLDRPASSPKNEKPLEEVRKSSENGAPTIIENISQQRRFVYDLMNLPDLSRERLLREFSLLDENDKGRRLSELVPLILERAEMKGCSKALFRKTSEILNIGG